jgi:hypothetical protein
VARHGAGTEQSPARRRSERSRALREKYGGEPDASRGTAAWTIQEFRKDALVAFMADLLAREEEGITQEQCGIARKGLETLVIGASALSDRLFLRRSIMGRLEAFTAAYVEWNEPPGRGAAQVAARRRALRKMCRARHKLAETMRKNAYVLANELDLGLVRGMYDAIGEIVRSLPGLFKNLAKAVERFSKRAP